MTCPDIVHIGVIILAGGRACRMGGLDKSSVKFGDRSFLHNSLADLNDLHCSMAGLKCVLDPVVLVGPSSIVVDPLWCPSVRLFSTCEQPAFGGPVAGVGAGLSVLEDFLPRLDWVFILSVDSPRGAVLLPSLFRIACDLGSSKESSDAGALDDFLYADAVVPILDGYEQRLCALYRFSFLQSHLRSFSSLRNVSVRKALGSVPAAFIIDRGNYSQDYDTLQQVENLRGNFS